jgi:hypothetical protein
MSTWYRLDDKGEPELIGGHLEYMAHIMRIGGESGDPGLWNRERGVVAQTLVGNCKVSSVFLYLDHAWDQREKGPKYWETMTFGPAKKGAKDFGGNPIRWTSKDCLRCGGPREQAEAQHTQTVRKLAKKLKVPVPEIVWGQRVA